MNYAARLVIILLLASYAAVAQVNKTVKFDYAVLYTYDSKPNKDTSLRIAETMLLQAGAEQSSYLSYNRFKADSILASYADQHTGGPISMPESLRSLPVLVKYRIYKEPGNKQYRYMGTFGIKTAAYPDTLTTLNWTLSDEESTVAGYRCKQATTHFSGRDYTAWYAMDIPISDGPYKFYGLPGLILSIYDADKEHVFTATEVRKKSQTVKLEKWKGPLLSSFETKKDYIAFVKEMKANPMLMVQQPFIGMSADMEEQAAARIKLAMDRYTNRIELTDEMP